jgi:hypothetical protein
VKEYLSALAGNECLGEEEEDEDLEDSVALFEVKFGDEKGLTCAATTWDQDMHRTQLFLQGARSSLQIISLLN